MLHQLKCDAPYLRVTESYRTGKERKECSRARSEHSIDSDFFQPFNLTPYLEELYPVQLFKYRQRSHHYQPRDPKKSPYRFYFNFLNLGLLKINPEVMQQCESIRFSIVRKKEWYRQCWLDPPSEDSLSWTIDGGIFSSNKLIALATSLKCGPFLLDWTNVIRWLDADRPRQLDPDISSCTSPPIPNGKFAISHDSMRGWDEHNFK